MSTAAEIRTAWNSKIWTHDDITDLTTAIHNYDIVTLAEKSTEHHAKLMYEQDINFFQYRVSKTREFMLTGDIMYTYPVTIQYYKEADINGTNYNAIEDAFETIFGLVRSELTINWNSTVDYWRTQTEQPNINSFIINNVELWYGEYIFTGYQQDTLS